MWGILVCKFVLLHSRKYVAEKVKDKFKIDVYQDVTKCLRLRAALEKLKKVLSVNLEETLNIGFLFGEKDFSFVVKRQLFEKIIVPILERVEKLLAKALADARLTVENIYSVEVVGLGSQVPAIIKILTDFFRMEPRRTMDAIECVAKGCALQCAIMSPTFKDWEFQVKERFHYSISSTWNVSSGDAHPNVAMIIPKGNLIPTMKALIFERSDIVTLDLQYANASELHALAMISIYKFGPFPSTNSKKAKLKVVVRLNRHGILSVESATLLEEEEVEVSVSKESDKETDAQVEAMNKKVIEINVPVLEIVLGALSTLDLQKFVEVEHEMALQDRAMEEAEDKKKAFEIYASDMFQKFFGEYHDFVTDPVRDKLAQQFYEVYSEVANAEVEAKDVNVAKLEELKKLSDPIEERYKEYTKRGLLLDQLREGIDIYKEVASSNNPEFAHIDLAEKRKILDECVEAEAWMRETKLQHESLPKHGDPALLSAVVREKMEALDRFCVPIMAGPKPRPAKRAKTDKSEGEGSQNA